MIAALLFTAIALFGLYALVDFKRQFRFWKDKNVPFMEPRIPMGNIGSILKPNVHFGYLIQSIYNEMKVAGDYCGIFFSRLPVLLVLSPAFAKTILVRDFAHFTDRGVYSNEPVDPLSANMFFLEGQRWKDVRMKVTPMFTSGKLRQMFPLIFSVGEKLVDQFDEMLKVSQDAEVYDLCARYTTDCISTCAFGFDANSLQTPDAEFVKMGRKVLHFSKLKALTIFMATGFRDKARALGIRFVATDVQEYFLKIVRDTIDYRKATGEIRKDFMQLLIDLMKTDESDIDKLTFNEVAAQAFGAYFAGFDSSSTTLAFSLHSLAFNEEIQEKARTSIRTTLEKHNNEWSYESIMEMTYLDQVIDESLRLNPPVTTIHRVVTKDYKLPNGALLKEGNLVVIPNLAFQRDAEIFPDPMKFDPDRFDENVKRTRHHFASLPFGEGPRYCLGMRFGLLQIKLALALLLHNYTFVPCAETDFTIKIETSSLIHAPSGAVMLNLRKNLN